jgi:hypothetical protein
MSGYTEDQREFLAWLEEIADIAEQEPATEEAREEARERAIELADKVMSYLAAVARVRAEKTGGDAKPTITDMEEDEVRLRETGFARAAVGMRVLIDRGEGEIGVIGSLN